MAEQITNSSLRKRQRSEDMLGSSAGRFRSVAMRTSNTPLVRSAPEQIVREMPMFTPYNSEGPTVNLLQNPVPVHPPLSSNTPTTLAVTRNSPASRSPPDQGATIYNSGVPLPNPGRAHRFCQNCNQVNHVRRKVCTNCGTPKPSALRNAIGVRHVNDVDNEMLREGNGSSGSGAIGSMPVHSSVFSSRRDARSTKQGRLCDAPNNGSDLSLQNNQSVRTVPARSLSIRSPGDDIPLFDGTWHRTGFGSVPMDHHQPRKLRPGQVLNEPLISINTFQPYPQEMSIRSSSANATDVGPPTASTQRLLREQQGLPSLFGGSSQGYGNTMSQVVSHGQTAGPLPSPYTADAEEPAPDSMPSSRGSTSQLMDTRLEANKFHSANGFGPVSKEPRNPTQHYANMAITQPISTPFFRQTSDMLQPQTFTQPQSKDHYAHQSFTHPNDATYGNSSPASDFARSLFPPTHGSDRSNPQFQNPDVQSRLRQLREFNFRPAPSDPVTRPAEQPVHLTVEESSRSVDDGRISIDNILMPREAGSNGQV